MLAAALLGSACGGAGDDDSAEPGRSEASGDQLVDRSAELTFGAPFGFNSFDPHKTPSPGSDPVYLGPVYDQLLTLGRNDDDEVVLVPQLAKSWEVSEDGLTITFELRDDVTFQDGTPFNADAVQANIERALGPGSTVASLLVNVESVEVADEYAAVFHLSRSDPSVPWSLATDTTGYMVSPAAMDNPDLGTNPVGTGPFRLVSAAKDAEVVYERWEDHWDPDAALVRRLIVSTIADPNARFNGLRSGEYDAMYASAPIDSRSKSLEAEGPGLR